MASWSLDPNHSQVEFSVKHMMITTVRGQFRKFGATITFDEADPTRSSVDAHIDAASIDTGAEARDAHLRSADFFDVERFPEVAFRSTGIERAGNGYRIRGELTIKDQTLPVTLDAEIEGLVPGLDGGRRASFAATTKISRKAWGLNWNVALESGGWLVGDEIKIAIEIALVSSPQAAEAQVEAEESPEPVGAGSR